MDIFECIRQRRSIRSYLDRQVEEDKLRKILEAARLAPSARNRQIWKFIVVKKQSLRRKLAGAANGQSFVAEAPVVIAACATETGHVMSCGHPAHLIDLAIAVDHMTLAACRLGLGTCWIGAFNQQEVKNLLTVPKGAEVVQLMTLGYAESTPPETPRKDISEIVSENGW